MIGRDGHNEWLEKQMTDGAPPSDKAALEFILGHGLGEVISASGLIEAIKSSRTERNTPSALPIDGIVNTLRSYYGIRLKEVKDSNGNRGYVRQVL